MIDRIKRPAVLAGRQAKTAFKNTGEVAEIAKAVEKSDVADAAVHMPRIFDRLAAFVEPPFDEQTTDRSPFQRQQTIGVAFADAGPGGNALRIGVRIGELALDEDA